MQTKSAEPPSEPSDLAIHLAHQVRQTLDAAAAANPLISAADLLDAMILALAADVATRTQFPGDLIPDADLYRVQVGTQVMEWAERYHHVMGRTSAEASDFLDNRDPHTNV